MSMFPPFLAFLGMVLFGIITVAGSFFNGTNQIVDSRIAQVQRASDLAGTSISLDVASVVGGRVTVDVTNTGRVALRDFPAWDVWANFQDPSDAHYTSHLTYTSAAIPGADEWAVDGIYLDPVAGIPESYEPGIVDPGETVRIVFQTSPNADDVLPNTLAISTPNGVHASTAWREWVEEPATPGTVDAGGALATDGTDLYALRGGGTNDFWYYDVSQNTWSSMHPTSVGAGDGAAMVVANNGYGYAMFGGNTTSFYRYKLSADSWQPRSSTPFPVQSGGALAYDGNNYIYAIGGKPLLGLPLAFWRYNISSNLWSALSNVPEGVGAGAGLAYSNGTVYATAGGGSTSFYAYDVAGGSWSATANTPTAVGAGGSLTAVGNYVYALMGNGTSFYRYETAGDKWVEMTPTPGDVGAGGALTYASSHFWALQGGGNDTLWRY